MSDQSDPGGFDSHGNNDDAPEPLKACFVPGCGGEAVTSPTIGEVWCDENAYHKVQTEEEWNSIPREEGRSLLQLLYDQEQNFELRCFWDAGFEWALGDEQNGYTASGHADSVPQAAVDMLEAWRLR